MIWYAMYKGPPTGLYPTLMHNGIRLRSWSRYSHIELVHGWRGSVGNCWSSSDRDDGVRAKDIDLGSGRWDVFLDPWAGPAERAAALSWFEEHEGAPYDFIGNLGFVLPFRTDSSGKFICSEAVAAARGLPRPWSYHPQGALAALTSTKLRALGGDLQRT